MKQLKTLYKELLEREKLLLAEICTDDFRQNLINSRKDELQHIIVRVQQLILGEIK